MLPVFISKLKIVRIAIKNEKYQSWAFDHRLCEYKISSHDNSFMPTSAYRSSQKVQGECSGSEVPSSMWLVMFSSSLSSMWMSFSVEFTGLLCPAVFSCWFGVAGTAIFALLELIDVRGFCWEIGINFRVHRWVDYWCWLICRSAGWTCRVTDTTTTTESDWRDDVRRSASASTALQNKSIQTGFKIRGLIWKV